MRNAEHQNFKSFTMKNLAHNEFQYGEEYSIGCGLLFECFQNKTKIGCSSEFKSHKFKSPQSLSQKY